MIINICNILVRIGMEIVVATTAVKPHELFLILFSIKKEEQQ